MKAFVPLAFVVLLGTIAFSAVEAEVCAGCISPADPKEPSFIDSTRRILAGLNDPSDVVEIISARTQVVAGRKVYLNVRLTDNRVCDITYVEQPWISPNPVDPTFDCPKSRAGVRRSIVGGWKDIDLNTEFDLVYELWNIAVKVLDDLDADNIRRTVVDVLSAKKQLVNGIMYHLELKMQDTSCLEDQDITNDDSCLFQTTGPTSICKIKMHRSFADKSPHSAKVVNSECNPEFQYVGDVIEANSSSEYVKEMANFALDELNAMTNSLYWFKLADILNTKSQIVNGVNTYLTLELHSTNCTKHNEKHTDDMCKVDHNQYTKMICQVLVWEQPWLKKKQVKKTSCSTEEGAKKALKKIEKRSLLGGEKSQDRSDPKIEELKRYISGQLTLMSHSDFTKKVVEVLNSTTQVVSGMLTRATVKVADTDCLKTENRAPSACKLSSEGHQICTLTILDQPWLNRKEVTQSECHAIPAEENTPDIFHKLSKLLNVDARNVDLINFVDFVKREKRMYKSDRELSARFRIFRANMVKAAYLNKTERGDAIYGATTFADMTKAEFKRYLGLVTETKSKASREPKMARIPDIAIPPQFDWRDQNAVTPVKNQGQCGSCWAFSVTGNIEGLNAISTGNLVSFSEQELVDCDKLDGGCDGGFFNTAFESIEELGGLETEEEYPYHARKETCELNKTDIRVSIRDYVNITSDEDQIAKYLVANGPISIGINANAMQFYMGGVSHPLKFLCNPNNLDHGVLIVGYGIHRTRFTHKLLPYWLIKNSWGPHWGNKGYYMAYRGDGTCGLNRAATSAIIE